MGPTEVVEWRRGASTGYQMMNEKDSRLGLIGRDSLRVG